MKYLTDEQNSFIDNHFAIYPNRSSSSRHKINTVKSSFYDAKVKRSYFSSPTAYFTAAIEAYRFVQPDMTQLHKQEEHVRLVYADGIFAYPLKM